MSMMIDAPVAEVPDVAIVVEDERASDAAWGAATHLRRSGLSVETLATGSPRKRFDRAVKRGPGEILVLGFDEGAVTTRFKVFGEPRAGRLLEALNWPGPTSK